MARRYRGGVNHAPALPPLDPAASSAFAAQGLDYRVVDADGDLFPAYSQAISRGFLAAETTDERIASARAFHVGHRMIGVYDPDAVQRATPCATVVSWPARLSLPGERDVAMWAISGVTVAVTHRRRGIARAMLEGELRAARDAGIPVAGLTVSEATIYGRFGFGPATFAADWSIDTRRVRWSGPEPAVRLDYIDRETAASDLSDLHERTRTRRPGEVDAPASMWARLAGTSPGAEGGDKIRAVRATDADGRAIGVVVYRLTEDESDYTAHTLDVIHMVTDGDDAYAALWRLLLTHDLVVRVRASLRTTDEPVRWMLGDQRAATVTVNEHEWLRVLDTAAALRARRYSAALRVTIRVDDPLGLATGNWSLEVDESGAPHVEASEGDADVRLPATSLGSLLAGGVPASTLHAAGLLAGAPEAVGALDRAFTSARQPQLSFWY